MVLGYAKARGYRDGDNSAAFDNLEPVMAKRSKKKVKHHASLDYNDVGEFMLQLSSQSKVSARAMELLILTVGRPGEVVGAHWSEFPEFDDESDFEKMDWSIPAERMKAKEPHVVPLSHDAIKILREMRKFGEGEFVFNGRKPGRHLTAAAMKQ